MAKASIKGWSGVGFIIVSCTSINSGAYEQAGLTVGKFWLYSGQNAV
jgi:hypothetical protein